MAHLLMTLKGRRLRGAPEGDIVRLEQTCADELADLAALQCQPL
jgi:hypothetical protein